MVKQHMGCAALTNYSSIIFFFRRGQILFMSGEYAREDQISLAIFAFLACALQIRIPAQTLQLPTVKPEWWVPFRNANRPTLRRCETAGLDPTYGLVSLPHIRTC
jgi:hypothetical protein